MDLTLPLSRQAAFQTRKSVLLSAGALVIFGYLTSLFSASAAESVRIGNYYCSAPNGIAFIKDDVAAFVIDPGGAYEPNTAAPDDSFHRSVFSIGAVKVQFDWGRQGDVAVGRITVGAPVKVVFRLGNNWPDFVSQFTAEHNGVEGKASVDGGTVAWRLQTWPSPISADATQFTVAVAPSHPVHLVAGFGKLPDFPDIDGLLARAQAAYDARRPKAAGVAGDFIGAIADSLNGSRFYSSDDKRIAISVSRGWIRGGANHNPYFCWDSFFSGLLASLDDPKTGRETVRAILACQTPEGLVPNYGHWSEKSRVSDDRSQPPVGALCVWKMNQRWPDNDFLREVYPALVKWHAWWMTTRDAKHDGLLEWGSSTRNMQNAKYETGWDDTPEFEGASMVGPTMNVYAVDLCSLWAMDAHYLALIADAIGQHQDVKKYRQECDAMNQRINAKLWNESLGMYCSRFWDNPDGSPGAFLTRLTPMNFYPLICCAPDADRAKRVLAVMTDPSQFWGDWILPTVSRKDPLFPQQIYWHGTVWGPVNYLVYQGVKRYAPPGMEAQFAQKSVDLFMNNWQDRRICGENYWSLTGQPGPARSDLHYTWGALLCLIGLESVVDLKDDGSVRIGPGFHEAVELDQIPWAGQPHHISVKDGAPASITP